MKHPIIITSCLLLILLSLAGPARGQVQDEEVRKEVDSLIRSGHRVMVNRVDSGLYYANKAREISERSGYVTGQINTLFLLGSISLGKGKYLDAITDFQSAEALARSVNDELKLGEAYLQIGQVMTRVEQYEQAEYYLSRALRAGIMHRDTTMIIPATYDLALRAYRTGSTRSATTGFYYGYYLAVRSGNDKMAITGLRQLGSLYLWENFPDRALQYYSLAADHAEARASRQRRAAVRTCLAQLPPAVHAEGLGRNRAGADAGERYADEYVRRDGRVSAAASGTRRRPARAFPRRACRGCWRRDA